MANQMESVCLCQVLIGLGENKVDKGGRNRAIPDKDKIAWPNSVISGGT